MPDSPFGSITHRVTHRVPELSTARLSAARLSPARLSAARLSAARLSTARLSPLTPLDPVRQAKRLPIRALNMLTSHLLHPEYLQPLTSAPVSIELDAKKSPLALLAQTCSQIGKPDPPSSSKLSSISGPGDKESGGRSSGSSLKLGEHRPSLDDKSSFKPYSKVGGDCRRDGAGSANGSGDKPGFRVPNNNNGSANGSSAGGPSFPPHPMSPSPRANSGTPPHHGQRDSAHSHRQSQSPGGQPAPHSQTPNGDGKPEQGSPGGVLCVGGGHLKKEAEPGKGNSDSPHQLANSSHARASVNSSSGSSESSPAHEGGKGAESQPAAQSNLGPAHVTPISPYKTGHSVFPLSASGMAYHGYAGYPSQFVPGLDHTKSLGKHPSSSPLTGASPPSFMQGLCRDPYCLSYPNAPHLGGSNCSSCVHDPSSSLKSGFPLVYPSHPLHSLHPSTLSSSVSPSLSHPLYTYGFMLQNDPVPHACNWVSAGGPCDKRFSTSDELLAHLRTHTSLPGGGMDAGKLLSAYPSVSSSGAASCHLHLPHQGGPASLASSFSLRAPPSLGLARYHPYGKVHLPPGPTSIPLHSFPSAGPYYPHYALYSQRLGSASALGYQ